MALLLITVLRPLFTNLAKVTSLEDEITASRATLGMATLFAYFIVSSSSFSVFREHEWRTWNRLRESAVNGSQLAIGKGFLPFTLVVGHYSIAFIFALLVLREGREYNWVSIGLVVVTSAFAMACLSVALAAVSRSMGELNAVGALTSMVISVLGGALTPVELLPGWLQQVARISPAYWTIGGLEDGIRGDGPGAVMGPVLALLAFAAVFIFVCGWKFRIAQPKKV